VVLTAISAVSSFFLALWLGTRWLPIDEPDHLLLVWVVLVVLFVMFWSVGVLTELQRDEPLSLENLLHFPVSLSGVFLLNYLTSLVSLSLIVFLPLTVGLSVAMVRLGGPA